METSLGLWLGVIALILVMLAIDLIAHRKASVISIKEAAIWSSIWVATGVLYATPLLAVLAMVEFTDIIFAVDSIPAIFAVTDEAFLVFTANAFAILGLRAMYFLLADLMHRFIYLKVGLSVLLVWVGVKMALHDVYKIPTTLSLTIIILVIGTAITASLLKTKSQAAVARVGPKAVYELASQAELASLEPIIRRRK